MTMSKAKAILVPGAWMGGWIWEPSAERLRARGIDAEAITLKGLRHGVPETTIANVSLGDHVQQVVEHVNHDSSRSVVLISHSYSGIVATCAADRLGDQVVGLIHVGAFIARNGRSLLDDWGGSDEARAQEKAHIEAAGDLWRAPTRHMLDFEADLSSSDRDFLASRLTTHPGRTILGPADLSAPAHEQPSTYVALTMAAGVDEAWNDAPDVARSATGWRRKHLVSGHWPMLSTLDATVDLLEAEFRHYASSED